MDGLAAVLERAAPARHVVFEHTAKVADQALDRLGRAGRERTERVRTDERVQLVELIDVAARATAALEPLEDLDADRQPVAARRTEPARLAREEALHVERALERAV